MWTYTAISLVALLQKTARARYMLSDADLASLGSIRKANPNHKDWQPMHLYLQSQVGGGGKSEAIDLALCHPRTRPTLA